MKTITIEAKVESIYAPKKITVTINNMDDDRYDKKYESQKSFNQIFEVGKGRYIVTIHGMNQTNDSTTVTINGDFGTKKTIKSLKENYTMVFYGNVN